jgi:hypothetical protein
MSLSHPAIGGPVRGLQLSGSLISGICFKLPLIFHLGVLASQRPITLGYPAPAIGERRHKRSFGLFVCTNRTCGVVRVIDHSFPLWRLVMTLPCSAPPLSVQRGFRIQRRDRIRHVGRPHRKVLAPATGNAQRGATGPPHSRAPSPPSKTYSHLD